eukprot:GFYU01008251.1.p1 GENE.GFYU01008251.1~~GFYU01008251.1.p1  ORF type:complete len:292 (+),score=70.21 GFYU01008251.1:823-1698(+)
MSTTYAVAFRTLSYLSLAGISYYVIKHHWKYVFGSGHSKFDIDAFPHHGAVVASFPRSKIAGEALVTLDTPELGGTVQVVYQMSVPAERERELIERTDDFGVWRGCRYTAVADTEAADPDDVTVHENVQDEVSRISVEVMLQSLYIGHIPGQKVLRLAGQALVTLRDAAAYLRNEISDQANILQRKVLNNGSFLFVVGHRRVQDLWKDAARAQGPAPKWSAKRHTYDTKQQLSNISVYHFHRIFPNTYSESGFVEGGVLIVKVTGPLSMSAVLHEMATSIEVEKEQDLDRW